jgi:hypothetical protein
MDNEKYKQIGRLALRQEGGTWRAYFAKTESMLDAIPLGSIRMNLVTGKKDRRKAFMDLMRECVADMIQEQTGTRPEWGGELEAPEHERAGRA